MLIRYACDGLFVNMLGSSIGVVVVTFAAVVGRLVVYKFCSMFKKN